MKTLRWLSAESIHVQFRQFNHTEYKFLANMTPALTRKHLPQTLLALLPFSLFFPTGIMYAGIVIFIISLLVAGDYSEKWSNIKRSPLSIPAAVLLGIVYFNAIFLSTENPLRWSALIHYQVFIFLIFFISAGGGQWQQRAKTVFLAGAVYGASVYYLTHLGVMPDWRIFKNYEIYAGNKSIALGIFHAIAAAWLLDTALSQVNLRKKIIQLGLYTYIAIALLLFAMTRTGLLLWFLLSLIVVLRHISFSWRGALLALSAVVCIAAAWQFSPVARERAAVTMEAIRGFSGGQMGTGQGNRLQFVQITGEMILEKPLLGHGVGSWLQQYPQRAIEAKAIETYGMSTPHNDYLLYAAELGGVGLFALLGLYIVIAVTALKMGARQGMGLFLIATTMLVGSLFNAIVRDWRFGMPMMILLAVTLLSDDDQSALSDQSASEN